MTVSNLQRSPWALIRKQHYAITGRQLQDHAYSRHAIQARIDARRLFRIYEDVYAVGRPELDSHGEWMAAVLASGESAFLSHGSAAALFGVGRERGIIEVSVPYSANPDNPGIRAHRRRYLERTCEYERIPVLHPAMVLVDLASYSSRDDLEAAINAADRRNLIDPETLRDMLGSLPRVPGIRALRDTLDRRTFVFTDSTLERYYLPLSDKAGLPRPQTQRYLGSYRVDFLYPFGMVVETDGLRYHRTAAQQTKDLERSQVHTANGLVPLRFSHAQIRYDPDHVVRILRATGERLMG